MGKKEKYKRQSLVNAQTEVNRAVWMMNRPGESPPKKEDPEYVVMHIQLAILDLMHAIHLIDNKDLIKYSKKLQDPKEKKSKVRSCRECGCTDQDCRQCIEKTGHACYWVDKDLCSACVPAAAKKKPRPGKGLSALLNKKPTKKKK